MKVKIDKKEVFELIKMSNSVLNGISLNPILANIFIETNKDKNELVMIASNDSMSVKSVTNNAEVLESGSILVKGKLLYAMISKLQNEILLLEKIDSKYLRISNSKFAANLNSIDETLYPSILFNSNESATKVIFNISTLKETYKRLMHSVLVNSEKTSPITGINIDSKSIDGLINFISTDSYKVSVLSKNFSQEKINIVIVPELIKLIIDSTTEDCDVEFIIRNNNDIVVNWNNKIIISKSITGNFPNIYNHFNIEAKTTIKVDSYEFENVLDHGLSLVMNEKSPSCLIKIQNNELEVIFKSIELGSSFEKVKISDFSGQDITFMINAKYLISMLKAFGNTQLVFEFTENNKPIIVRDSKNNEFKQLILPMRYN